MSYLLRSCSFMSSSRSIFAGSNVLQSTDTDCYVILLCGWSQLSLEITSQQSGAAGGPHCSPLLRAGSVWVWLGSGLTVGPFTRWEEVEVVVVDVTTLTLTEGNSKTVVYCAVSRHRLQFEIFNFSVIKLHQNQINISVVLPPDQTRPVARERYPTISFSNLLCLLGASSRLPPASFP